MKIKIAKSGLVINYDNIQQIIIYGNGEKLFTMERDYFEEYRVTSDGRVNSVYDGRVHEITLTTEPKRARKENLTRSDNYLLKYHSRYSWENGYTLYIHNSEIGVTDTGEFIHSKNNGETCYIRTVKLCFTHGITFRRCKVERVCPVAGNEKFTPPEGCKWSSGYSNDSDHPNYDITHRSYFDENASDYIVKRWYEAEQATELFTIHGYISRHEKTTDRLQREQIADICNEHKVFHREVSHYEIENMMKYFDITIKTEV